LGSEWISAYRDLFRDAFDPAFVDELRAATNGGWALGSERFKQAIAAAQGRRAAPLPRGRKAKAPSDNGKPILL